jgi:predicted AlkP superfamily pyrophosphatase or phosphodiesterase
MKAFECRTIDIAPTIAKLLEIPMSPPTGQPIKQIEALAAGKACKRVVLIIVDSLGYSIFMRLSHVMWNLQALVIEGILLRCRSTATYTSPAIASIFTGYLPEEHRIFSTGDIYIEREKDPESLKLRSIMEWACLAGMKASVVIESKGAESFRGRIKEFYGVPDSENILDYDRRITAYAVQALRNEIDLLAVHLRALDRFSHRAGSWDELKTAAEAIDKNLGEIFRNAGKGTMFLICGDHAVHGWKKWLENATKEEVQNHRENLVALIAGCC